MALNIKNEEAHELASRLEEATGTSLTEAVTSALRETLRRAERPVDRAVLLAEIQRFVAELPDRGTGGADEILGYDELRLPA